MIFGGVISGYLYKRSLGGGGGGRWAGGLCIVPIDAAG
jgi:hypothetical protein